MVATLTLESQNLRFPGQWFQSETGLHQNWHRDYDPTTGRYLQADPLGLVDGPSVHGYAKQRPNTLWDALGLYVRISMSRNVVDLPGGPYGHIGIAVNSCETYGHRPVFPILKNMCLDECIHFSEGEVSRDLEEEITETIVLDTNSAQDQIVQTCILEHIQNPPYYHLLLSKRTSFVKKCLARAGIGTADTIFPKEMFVDLKNHGDLSIR